MRWTVGIGIKISGPRQIAIARLVNFPEVLKMRPIG